MGIICINDKEYSLFDNNYVWDFNDSKQWCQRCVYYGEKENLRNHLCCEDYFVISIVAYSGHCDKFSTDKKINPLKLWLLKLDGIRLKNKVR